MQLIVEHLLVEHIVVRTAFIVLGVVIYNTGSTVADPIVTVPSAPVAYPVVTVHRKMHRVVTVVDAVRDSVVVLVQLVQQ